MRESSPLRTAALVVGVVFLLVGVLGFVPGITTNYDTMTFANHHSDAKLFGIFEVSVLHNIVHLLFGAIGIAASKNARSAYQYLLWGGIAYLALFIYGSVIDKESSANFIPVNGADDALHLVLGLGMVGLALAFRRRPVDAATGTGGLRGA